MKRVMRYVIDTEQQTLRLQADSVFWVKSDLQTCTIHYTIRAVLDANWVSASELYFMSGGSLWIGKRLLNIRSKPQPIVSQWTCEANLLVCYFATRGDFIVKTILDGSQTANELHLYINLSSELWLQEAVHERHLCTASVLDLAEVSDIFTKNWMRERFESFVNQLGVKVEQEQLQPRQQLQQPQQQQREQ